MKKFLTFILVLILTFSLVACGNEEQKEKETETEYMTDQQFTLSQLTGVDSLGRKISPASKRKEGKYVGIYYFLWHGAHTNKIYDTSEILKEYENGVIGNPQNPLWEVNQGAENYDSDISPNGAFHIWGKPLYGYYNSRDPWIAKKHLKLLSYAEIDYLLLDYTNTFIYEEATLTLINAILEMQREGWLVPQIAFMLPIAQENSEETFERVYTKFLSIPEYKNAFFTADVKINPSGKPLVVGTLGNNIDNISEIWYMPLQWPFHEMDNNALPWIDWSADNKQYNHNGKMCVSIAQHTDGEDGTWSSDPYLYPNAKCYRGRGWTPDCTDNGDNPENVLSGTNFQFQWDNVFNSEEDIYMVVVTGWNEWIAQKQSNLQNKYHTSLKAVFVDSFSEAFSRDAEMLSGGFGDNYYLQLIQNVRKFKYENADTNAIENKKASIDINDGFSAWSKVENNYLDAVGDVIARNYQSVDPNLIYTDNSNRNDIVRLKIANDSQNLYVLVETLNDVTEYVLGDTNWMTLYISTGEENGFTSFNYVINRNPNGSTTSIEKINGDTVSNVGSANYKVDGNRIFFEIPLSALGVSSAKQISIKATDNIQKFLDADDFYISGDSAPIGRLSYAYKLA